MSPQPGPSRQVAFQRSAAANGAFVDIGAIFRAQRSVANDPKLTLGTAHAITSAYADPQSKRRDRKDLPLETRIQFSHLHSNALKFRACGACREVGVACGYVGAGALPSDIRLAA